MRFDTFLGRSGMAVQPIQGERVGATTVDVFGHLAKQGAMIERLSSDSRSWAPGVAFFAYPGEAADGRSYIGDAIHRGAAAVVWEADDFAWRPEWQVPNMGLNGLKGQAGALAHAFYGRPSESMWVCGVTGTNGKTSCTQWIAALMSAQGIQTGVIGTLGSGFPRALSAAGNTTPDALELHRVLAGMKREGARAVAMEVSSHGLTQGRVNGVAFDCGLFTNLSHDHLDYHGSMDAYAEAKAMLFDEPTSSVDIGSQDLVYATLNGLEAKAGMTVLLISHDIHTVMHYSDSTLALNRGVIYFGESRQLSDSLLLQKIFGVGPIHEDHAHPEHSHSAPRLPP